MQRGLIVGLALACLAVAVPANAASVRRTGARAYEVTVHGAPQSDLTMARLDFRLGAYARHPTRRSLRVSVAGSTGRDYLAAGRLLPVRRGTLTALVALVNRRPPGSLAPDLAFVRVDVAGARLTHRPRVSEVVGAFARRARAGAVAPAMCTQTARTLAARNVAAGLRLGPRFRVRAAVRGRSGLRRGLLTSGRPGVRTGRHAQCGVPPDPVRSADGRRVPARRHRGGVRAARVAALTGPTATPSRAARRRSSPRRDRRSSRRGRSAPSGNARPS